jgi:hypothetical protein
VKLNRKFGKILALLLALTMMLSYAAGVLADDPPIDVDVNNGERKLSMRVMYRPTEFL